MQTCMELTADNVKKYMRGVFEAELDIYMQEQLLSRMETTYRRLGVPASITKPHKEEAKIGIVSYMYPTGTIIGLIFGIIMGIVGFAETGGFGGFFVGILAAIIFGVIGFIVGGIVIGGILGVWKSMKENDQLEADYQASMKRYEAALAKDRSRVREETRRKERLLSEIQRTKQMISDSKKHLQQLYDYNVLCPDYRNLCAVGSIYGYLQKGRTMSLAFNELTGDQGAYNIYEYEMRMNLIIVNTQEILNRLDEICARQYELVEGIRAANARLDALCKGVNKHIKNTNTTLENMENCMEMIEYQTERANQRMEFMTWMSLVS